MSINGKVNYWHFPCDEDWGFTYCKHCKGTCERVKVEFHQGIAGDWMVLGCPKCKKSIWTSEIDRKPTKDDKKCAICGKPTNWIDCESYGGDVTKKTSYWCSKKCYDKQEKLDEKEEKENGNN